jgi:hypothetical protein
MDVNYTSTNKKIIRSIKNGIESYDIKDKMTGKNNLSRAIRVYRGSRGTAPPYFKFGTKSRYAVNFTGLPPVTYGKSSGTR